MIAKCNPTILYNGVAVLFSVGQFESMKVKNKRMMRLNHEGENVLINL